LIDTCSSFWKNHSQDDTQPQLCFPHRQKLIVVNLNYKPKIILLFLLMLWTGFNSNVKKLREVLGR
jgi:hypothetical protein